MENVETQHAEERPSLIKDLANYKGPSHSFLFFVVLLVMLTLVSIGTEASIHVQVILAVLYFDLVTIWWWHKHVK